MTSPIITCPKLKEACGTAPIGTTFESEEAALTNIQRAHSIFNKIEKLNCPTVALIHGFCLGGGMELALACKYRIAEEDSSRLGLPEVKLGIHPGFGSQSGAPRRNRHPVTMSGVPVTDYQG